MNQTAAQWSKVMETHSAYPLVWGPTNIDRYIGDPKRLGFFMARYKFAGKMLRRCKAIIDVGCGDGMGTIGFLNETEATRILGIDFEPTSIDYTQRELLPALRALRPRDAGRLTFEEADFLTIDCADCGRYQGLACLDVIEHIEPERADDFIARMALLLDDYGVAVIGTPSLAGEAHASVHSKAGHINLYDPDRLRSELEAQFHQVFIWGMNDEIPHLGYDKFYHYILALCIK